MENEKIPGGLPGVLPDGNPAKSNDITPVIRQAYTYQDFCIYIQICKSLKDSTYKTIWVELHEDFLAITPKGEIDAFQVKTKANEGLMWSTNDTDLHKIIKNFNALNKKEKIRNFYVYSNISIYLPQESNRFSSNANKSIYFFKQQLINFKEDTHLSPETLKILNKLSMQSGCSTEDVRNIFYKLEFIKGPLLSSIFYKNTDYLIQAYPFLNKIKKDDIGKIELSFITQISTSSKSYISQLDNHSYPILKNGNTVHEIYSKKIEIQDFKRKLDHYKYTYYLRKIFKYLLIIISIFIILNLLIRNNKNENPLKLAVATIKSAKDSNLPVDFASSIAIIRANNTKLFNLDLSGASLACQDMSKLDLRRLNGQYLKAAGVDFSYSNLSNALLLNSELNMSRFQSSILIDTDFTNSNLLYANFKESDTRFSSFNKSTLQGAILNNADFTASSFQDTSFYYAEMKNSFFNQSNFLHAKLTKANISNSDFLDAKNLLQSTIDEACIEYNSPAKLPKGLKQPSNICEDKTVRAAFRATVGAIGIITTLKGYCKSGEIIFRPPDSKVMPENNDTFYIGNE
ncbi:hypothetical protein Asch03_00960 [Acinetobacter schindleri]